MIITSHMRSKTERQAAELRQFSSIAIGRCMTAEYALDSAMSGVIGRAPSIRSIKTTKPP